MTSFCRIRSPIFQTLQEFERVVSECINPVLGCLWLEPICQLFLNQKMLYFCVSIFSFSIRRSWALAVRSLDASTSLSVRPSNAHWRVRGFQGSGMAHSNPSRQGGVSDFDIAIKINELVIRACLFESAFGKQLEAGWVRMLDCCRQSVRMDLGKFFYRSVKRRA